MLFEEYNPLDEKMFKVLSVSGECDESLKPPLENSELLKLYKLMLFIRIADKKAIALQRQGRMGTYAPQSGQEASQIGSVYYLKQEDWIVPSYRELTAVVGRGVPLRYPFLYWMGNEWGCHFPEGFNILPFSIPISTQLPHAAGIGWGLKSQKKDGVVVAYCGDGGTSEGDFHEALNFAGVFKAPVIFFVQNNQFAISCPRKQQTASKTLAQKAIAYGFPGIQVDGMDIFAVLAVAKEAIERARKGEGPFLIEAVNYRYGPHTTADDPTKYRGEEEIAPWIEKDPLIRFTIYLKKTGVLTDEQEKVFEAELAEEVEKEVAGAENWKEYEPSEIFDYTYTSLPEELQKQKKYLMEHLKSIKA